MANAPPRAAIIIMATLPLALLAELPEPVGEGALVALEAAPARRPEREDTTDPYEAVICD